MSIERDLYKKHIPLCVTRPAIVDQYSWPEKDTTERVCDNGISHPIYACNGNISRTLPLDMYPKVNEVHPHVRNRTEPHFGSRDPRMRAFLSYAAIDKQNGRIEGFYM